MIELILGVNNCFAVKRWPSPHDWLPVVADILRVRHCQFSLDLLPVTTDLAFQRQFAARVGSAAKDHGVQIHSSFTGLAAYRSCLLAADDAEERTQAERWYRHVIDMTALMGGAMAGGHVGAFSVATYRDATRRTSRQKHLIDAMHRLAEHAAASGLTALMFENLAVTREYGHTIEEAVALERELEGSAVPWVLCLDLGHPAALRTGTDSDDLVQWLRAPWRRQSILQLQQSQRGSDRHGPFTSQSNSNGLVDHDLVYAGLNAGSWSSPVHAFLEVIPAHELDDDQALQDMVESVDYWRE